MDEILRTGFALSRKVNVLSEVVESKSDVFLTDTDIDVTNQTVIVSSSFKSTSIRSLNSLSKIEVEGANTYHSGQHLLYYINYDEGHLQYAEIVRSERISGGNFTINNKDFPSRATHYLIRGVSSISESMRVTEYKSLKEVCSNNSLELSETRSSIRSALSSKFKKASVVDITRYRPNLMVEPILGREVYSQTGYLSEFSGINLNIEYHVGYVSSVHMYDYYKNYLGKAEVSNNSLFTLTDSRCYYVKIEVPSPSMVMVVSELMVNSPSGNLNPKYEESEKIHPDSMYKLPLQTFGDSIVARPWIDTTLKLTDMNGTFFSYGGCTSSLILHQMRELADTNGNQFSIIWCGHNNINETQTILSDVRKMVRLRGDCRFLVVSSPSGTYGSEQNTIEFVNKSKELEKRLQSIYGPRFLNMRESMVNGGYDMGDVRLTQPFIQPSLNSLVDIYVSDVPFMVYENPESIQNWMPNMNLFKVGRNGEYDEYEIMGSSVTSGKEGYLSAKLVSISRVNEGQQVGNLSLSATPAGSSESINYDVDIEVFKTVDKYLMEEIETTPSSSRSDGVHPNDYGGKCEGELIAYRISSLNFM